MHIAPLLFVVFLIFHTVKADMWMHVDVKNIERKPCPIDETSWGTETSGCASLSYMTLDERILPHHERRSSSFEHINGASRPTVTHWSQGRLSDWMLSIQFVSVDPVYGLARTCDRSGYVRVFQNESDQVLHNSVLVEKSVKIQGQCFEATVQVQASNEVCPWCVDDSKTTTTTTTTSVATTHPPAQFFAFEGSNGILLLTMLVLTVFSFLALMGTIVLLVFYLVDRKRPEDQDLQSEITSYPTIFTTKSSDQWGEYPQDTWASYHPVDIEAAYQTVKDSREIRVYKVIQEEDEDNLCTPSANSTFLFAYSNDFDKQLLSETTDFIINTLAGYQPRFSTFASVRFDVKSAEVIELHNTISDFNASVYSHLPDPSLGFPDTGSGSDVIDVIRKFQTLPNICGSMIFLLVKRYSNETSVDQVISQLQNSHVSVHSIGSNSSSGGLFPQTVYNFSSRTNGIYIFADEQDIPDVTFMTLNTMYYQYLIYSLNPIVSGKGSRQLSALQVPGNLEGDVFLQITFQDHGSLSNFNSLNFTVGNTTLEFRKIDLFYKSTVVFGFLEPASGSLNAVNLEFDFETNDSESLEIRIYSHEPVDNWVPFPN